MEEYKARVHRYSKEELIDVLSNIDKEKFPDRYAIARQRYDEIKDNPEFSRGEPLEKYQTGMRRFWAMILDGFFVQAFSVVLFFSFGSVFGMTESDGFEIYINPVYSVWLTLVFGKTLGKHICGVKVVAYPDESKIVLRSVLMREIFPIACALLTFPFILLPISEDNSATYKIQLGAVFFMAVGSLAWLILELVTMSRDPKRRAFHDKIAGTVVIKTKGL